MSVKLTFAVTLWAETEARAKELASMLQANIEMMTIDDDARLLIGENQIEVEQPGPAASAARSIEGAQGAPGRFEIAKWADDEAGWDGETGAPGIMKFASAVQVWSALQNRAVSIAECARVFNVDPERVIEAVDEHSFMTLRANDVGELMIVHDGAGG